MATRDGASTIAQLGSGTSTTTSWSVNPAAGDKVIVAVFCAVQPDSVVDNGTTPKTLRLEAKKDWAAGKFVYVYQTDDITQPSAGAYGVTVTITGLHSIVAAGMAYSNAPRGDPYAVISGAATGTAVSSGAAGDDRSQLYFAAFADASSLNPETITFTWTNGAEQARSTNGSSFFAGAIADDVTAGDGSQTATWTLGDSVGWACLLLVYAEAPAMQKRPQPWMLIPYRYLIRLRGPMAVKWIRQAVEDRQRHYLPNVPIPSGGTLFTQDLLVTTVTAASLNNQVGKALFVSTTTAPSLLKQVGKVLAVSTITTRSLLKQVGKVLFVTTTTVPSLVTAKLKLVLLAVNTTTVPVLLKTVGKVLFVTTSTVPSLLKQVGKSLFVTTTTVANLIAVKAKFITLAVTTTTVPVVLKQIGKRLAVVTTTTPSLLKQVAKILAVSTTTAKSLLTSKLKLVALAVTTTTVPVITRQVGKLLAVVTATVPVLTQVATLIGGAAATALRFAITSLEGIRSVISGESTTSVTSSRAGGAISAEPARGLSSQEPDQTIDTEVPGR